MDEYEDLHPLIFHKPKESSGVIPSVWEQPHDKELGEE